MILDDAGTFTTTSRAYDCPALIQQRPSYRPGHYYWQHAPQHPNPNARIRDIMLYSSGDDDGWLTCRFCGATPLLWDNHRNRAYSLNHWHIPEEP